MIRVPILGSVVLLLAPGAGIRADDVAAAAGAVAAGLACALSLAPERDTVRRIVVLPFAEGGRIVPGNGRTVAEAVVDGLRERAQVEVVDPEALQALVGEGKLRAMMGELRADDPALLDRAQAQAVVTGALAADGERVRVTAKLVLVPSGKPVGSSQAHADGGTLLPARGESARIEVAMRRLADGLATGFAKLPGSARYRRLAVLPFAEVGDHARGKRLGTIVASEIATDLRRDHALLLVEREKMGQVLGELKLSQMIAVDSTQAAQIGSLADAEALVIGSVSEAGDRYLVTARIVATQTGETLAAESASVHAAGLVALASDAVVLRSRTDAALRSLAFPGLGQVYNRQKLKAYAFAGTEVALLGGAATFHLLAKSEHRKYRRADTASDATYYYQRASTRYQTRNWLLVGAAAVWGLNVVDAWVSGVDGESLLGGQRVVAVPVPMDGGGGLALAGRF